MAERIKISDLCEKKKDFEDTVGRILEERGKKGDKDEENRVTEELLNSGIEGVKRALAVNFAKKIKGDELKRNIEGHLIPDGHVERLKTDKNNEPPLGERDVENVVIGRNASKFL